MILELQVSVYYRAPGSIVQARQAFHKRVRSHASRPDDCSGVDHFRAIDLHAVCRTPRYTRARPHFDSFAVKPVERMLLEARRDAAQNFRRGLEQQKANLRRRDAALAPDHIAKHQITELRHEFHAGVAASHEGEHGAPRPGVLGMVCVLAKIEHTFPQYDGVFE